jgi:hypothetical protein
MSNTRAAILFCLLPWIVFGFVKVLYALVLTPQLPAQEVTFIAAVLWMVISPAISAMAILVTFREGQWSKDAEIARLEAKFDALEDENISLTEENARIKSTCGVFEFD